jgi:hypothetical protein
VQPVIYDDLYLLKLGFFNIGGSFIIKSLIFLIAILILAFLFVKAFKYLFKLSDNVSFGKYSKIAFWVVGISLLANTIKSGITIAPNNVFQLNLALIIENIQRSAEAHNNLKSLDVGKLNKITHYGQYKLKTKPDIYLLFVESYGKVLYENEKIREKYIEYIQNRDSVLFKAGWFSASCLSRSPVSGGRSWISFSTVLYGFNIHDQGSFLFMLRNPGLLKYPNMIRYFKSQGYHSYWLDPIREDDGMVIPWDIYTRFYSVDSWIHLTDMNYHGKLYGFGPFPPDQYSLDFSKTIMEKNGKQPKIFFFITHNSHYPYDSPDSISSNWQSLNRGYENVVQQKVLVKSAEPDDYFKSVKYDLDVLTRFILDTHNKQAVFVLVGDHQPPLFTSEKDGFETPVHIISRDSTFENNFQQYGFNKGLRIQNTGQSVVHEAIYSMVLREIIRRYGEDTSHLPTYNPNGIIIKKL